MARQADRLLADALHQAAIADDHPGAVIDQAFAEAGRQQPLGDRHANGRRQSLAERAGGGLDARRFAKLGMSGGGGMQLAEILDVVDGHAGLPGQMQQRVEQHGSVPG